MVSRVAAGHACGVASVSFCAMKALFSILIGELERARRSIVTWLVVMGGEKGT